MHLNRLCPLLAAVAFLSLPLAQAEDAASAFWTSPSPMRLVDFGHAVRGDFRQYKQLNDGDTVKVPTDAQFDAAKKRMAAGAVVPFNSRDFARAAVKLADMPHAHKLPPKPVKASLFTSQADVRLETESTVDEVAGMLGVRVTMTFSGMPVAWAKRHEGPGIGGITGFGDVGEATLRFHPALTVLSVERNGLLTAGSMSTTLGFGGGHEDYCPLVTYSRQALNGTRYAPPLSGDLVAVRGYPKRSGDSPLVAFVTSRKLDPRGTRMSSRSANALVDGAPGTVALHEVDLNRDGSADILVWELSRMGELDDRPVYDRAYFVNVGGQWFDAGSYSENECT